jgi:hypothetical protein
VEHEQTGAAKSVAPIDMFEDDVATFRKYAEEAIEQAARSTSPIEKRAWLQLAEGWLKLASLVDGKK